MKKFTKTFFSFMFALFLLTPVFITGCQKNKESNDVQLLNCSIEHEDEFGGVYIKTTIENFNKLGFEYGDSVNITFSNGKELKDIPYYNGYYTKNGEKLLVAYPGYPYIKVCINNGDDLWEELNFFQGTLLAEKHTLWGELTLDSNVTASISLAERGKFLKIQQARDIHYLDDRTLYPNDQVFANFRSLTGGRLKKNFIYRSASPCDNQHNRAKVVNDLIEDAGIEYILDLADNSTKIEGYIAKDDFQSDYFETLYNNDKVLPLALNMNFNSEYFKDQIILALKAIAENEGPFLIHCTEGKDRTGFMCLLVEALAGATYGEIVDDYMTTYFNYYAITKAFDKERYTTIVENVLNPMIETIVGQSITLNRDTVIEDYATAYVMQNNALTEAQINTIKTAICR